jgi:molybdopterin converting factor subunit 1
MKINVRLFARAKDLAGTDVVAVELPDGATIGELRRQLALAYPNLAPLLHRSALAVNDAFAPDDVPLTVPSEVAVLPPVSGGSLA